MANRNLNRFPTHRDMTNPSLPTFWAEKYQADNRPPWDLGQAAPPFTSFLAAHPELTPGKTAVLGSGLGNDALLFAQEGFEVTGFDFVEAAVLGASQAAAERAVSATFLQRDLFALGREFAHQFDYVVEHTCYCAIDPARRDDYVQLAYDILKPGGHFIGLFWAHDRQGGPPFGSDAGQLRDRFASQFEILSFELAEDSISPRQGQEYLGLFRKPAEP
jgi:methyl halide transferase